MNTVLTSIHAITARRGDGLRHESIRLWED
jgi:hypothetical protein